MPTRPVSRAEVAELAGQVGSLQGEVHRAFDLFAQASERARAAQVTAANARTAVDATIAARRRFIVWALIILLLSMVVTVVSLGTIVSRCFINVPQSGVYRVACDAIPGYDAAIKKQNVQLGQFNDLLQQIPRNRQQVEQEQQEIARLKAALRAHGIVVEPPKATPRRVATVPCRTRTLLCI